MNQVNILGTLTKDVELNYATSGSAIGKFTIAYNKKFKGQDGQHQEKTSYFDCVAFGRRGEIISQYFSKGQRILVSGELEQDKWQDKDGNNRYAIKILVNGFDFIEKNNSSSNNGTQQQNAPIPEPQQMPEIDVDGEGLPF